MVIGYLIWPMFAGLIIVFIIVIIADATNRLVSLSWWACACYNMAMGSILWLTVRVKLMIVSIQRPAAWVFICALLLRGVLETWGESGNGVENQVRTGTNALAALMLITLYARMRARVHTHQDKLSAAMQLCSHAAMRHARTCAHTRLRRIPIVDALPDELVRPLSRYFCTLAALHGLWQYTMRHKTMQPCSHAPMQYATMHSRKVLSQVPISS